MFVYVRVCVYVRVYVCARARAHVCTEKADSVLCHFSKRLHTRIIIKLMLIQPQINAQQASSPNQLSVRVTIHGDVTLRLKRSVKK